MDISTKNINNFLIVRLKGDLDMHTVPKFKKTIKTKMKENNLCNLVINFKGVNFIDSTGVGAILGRYRNISKNGKMILVAINPHIERIFKLSGILNIIPVYEKENEIFRDIKGGDNIA